MRYSLVPRFERLCALARMWLLNMLPGGKLGRGYVVGLIVVMGMLLISCSSTVNYTHPLEPRFVGNFAGTPSHPDGRLKVVSYNVAFGENVDAVAQELAEIDELKDADIILLQEMDEAGTEYVAKALDYNYVYFPASVHQFHDKNFGNAILSKWPISDAGKFILPYTSPRNGEQRIAVKAVVKVGDTDILTYSVHTETVWLGPKKRAAQVEALLSDIPQYEHIVVGGDFNTVTPRSITRLEERFNRAGLEKASNGVDYSVKVAPVQLTLDHIFTKGMSVIQTGYAHQAAASDHFPVWVEAALNPR